MIETILKRKPKGNGVYATERGWCKEHKTREELLVGRRGLLAILNEAGYDKFGAAIEEPKEPTPVVATEKKSVEKPESAYQKRKRRAAEKKKKAAEAK